MKSSHIQWIYLLRESKQTMVYRLQDIDIGQKFAEGNEPSQHCPLTVIPVGLWNWSRSTSKIDDDSWQSIYV